MGKKNRLSNATTEYSGIAMKVISFQILPWIMIGLQVPVVLLSSKVALFPGAEVMQSIIGTCAEIIAGLYGITMAGYTFFLSRIDALSATDATLDYVTDSIKNRFKILIWYITFNVMVTLFLSIVLMYAPMPTGEKSSFFYRLFCNEFLVFLGFSISLILYYSVQVIDPNCIRKEAAKLKKRLCRTGGLPGSASEFISLYDRIESRCNGLLPASVLNQLHENKGKHFELTLELLQEQKLLPLPLVMELTRIHRYYECMVNASPMSVSQEMCILAARALQYLEQVK